MSGKRFNLGGKMSTNLIDDLTECEAKELLNEICAKLHILGKHRRPETILKGLDTELKFLKSIKQVNENAAVY